MIHQQVVSLIRCSSSSLPPKPKPKPPSFQSNNSITLRSHSQLKANPISTTHTRRDVLTILSIIAATSQTHALAFELGISGPKSWLKDQKKKAAKFLLAPIYDSRESLQAVYTLLSGEKSEYTSEDLEGVQKLLRSAARDCVVQDRNSFVAFQANTGVEVCTFTLLVKNAASLLEDKNPIKLAAEAKLNYLIRSFTVLSDVANEVDIRIASSRQKVSDALMDTMSSLDTFEQGIKDCLEI